MFTVPQGTAEPRLGITALHYLWPLHYKEVRGQRHAPAAPYPRERPGTHCKGGWVGLRAGMDSWGKSRHPTAIRSPDRPARSESLYRLSYLGQWHFKKDALNRTLWTARFRRRYGPTSRHDRLMTDTASGFIRCRTICFETSGLSYLESWLTFILSTITHTISRSQWPRGLSRRSSAARRLRLWVRIPSGAWMFVCCECCVLSCRGLCDELNPRPEESFWLRCVVVCDLETSCMRGPWPIGSCCVTEK